MTTLSELRVLVIDCQSSGATPAHGDLLELGWSITSGTAAVLEPRSEWTKTERPVSRIVRKLTGWEPTVPAVEPGDAWMRLLREVSQNMTVWPRPTVIHFAQFERRFLEHVHGQLEAGAPLPLDIVCVHAVAERLFPNLPRRNLRVLAGTLGGSPDALRRAGPHVAATALVWRALVPKLAELGIHTWESLHDWLAIPSVRPRKIAREFPMPAARRRSLPDKPGVYRFLRPNGDVLYVGKAASLKKRVASHFTANKSSRATERALEMLSQAHDVDVTTTETALEAALLEVDEIKRLDPPYNVHLRAADRDAWFATRDWRHVAPAVDDTHLVGPLPSRVAIAGIAAMRELLLGAELDLDRASAAVGVPRAFGPPLALFRDEWEAFRADELEGDRPDRPDRRILEASTRIAVQDSPDEEDAPAEWDRATVRRYLERIVVGEGTLVRRGRLLALLSHSEVGFREAKDDRMRGLTIVDGAFVDDVHPWSGLYPSLRARLACFDASRYDRLRVLATELRRVRKEGGHAEIRVGRHLVPLGPR
ncbi:MAG: GIY-YIG nuclease family protein [Labilithrix sp.]